MTGGSGRVRVHHAGCRRWAVLGVAALAVVSSPAGAVAASYVPINGAGSTWSSDAVEAWRGTSRNLA
jgi:hypothetical protein